MSRPRRGIQPQKYVEEISEDDDEGTQVENESNAASAELSPIDNSDDNLSEATEAAEERPLFVSVPTYSQVIQTRALITQQAAKIALLRAKYEEQKQISDALEEKLQTAERILFETHATIAPVSRVPPEILALVFTVHVHEHQESPWLLMQVSRAWRAAALMTRTIWGRIILAPSTWAKLRGGNSRVRVCDGMEVCYNQVQLTRALKRAGAAPLDLKVVFTNGFQRRRWKMGMTNPEYGVLSLFNYIPLHQTNPRLRSLIIATDAKLTLPSHAFAAFSFTDIVTLSLDQAYPGVIEKVVDEARGLRNLRIQAPSLDKMEGCKWWDELEDLSIEDLGRERHETIRPILRAATALTALSIHNGIVSDPNAPDEQIHMPLLKRLELRFITGFWPIDCPHLTHLSLHSAPSTVGLDPGSIRLPHLAELSFSVSHIMENTLNVFDFPPLHKFDFQCGWGKAVTANIVKTLWTGPDASTIASVVEPEILCIGSTLINSKTLARALAGRKLLREIHMEGVLVTAELFENLMPVRIVKQTKKSKVSKGGNPAWQIACPALRILLVDLYSCKLKQEQTIVEGSAKALAAARIKAGAPFERFAVRFPNDDDWTEFVDK